MTRTVRQLRISQPPIKLRTKPLGSESVVLSTFLNRPSENVIIEAVIVAELELSDIERRALGADFVKRVDDAAFENASEAWRLLVEQGRKAG